jgi:transcriptional regulator with XRE-family HTH domain
MVSAVAGEVGKGHSALSVFAGELRQVRAAAGLSQDQLSEKIAYSSSLVAMVESSRRIPSLDFARRCDEALGTGGVLARLHPLVAGEAYPSWFRPFVELERTAVSLRTWEPVLIPGLLQTEDYARAVLRAARPTDPDERISQAVVARLERQAILDREDPPMLWVVLDEAVLRRPVGGAGVMSDQLQSLLITAQRPKIIVQVVPLGVGANAGMTGAFVIASFTGAPDTVHLDSAGTGLIADRADVVASCAFAFDALRADALSPACSFDLIRKGQSVAHD